MNIKAITQGEVTVIGISGNLDANTVPQAQSEIMPLLTPDCRLVLDMTDCQYVSSSGLRLLLMIAKKLKTAKGGQWCLANVSDEVMDVMKITGFAQFFKTSSTVSAAIELVRQS